MSKKSGSQLPRSGSFNLQKFLAAKTVAVNEALDRFLPAEKCKPATIHRAMRYSLFAGGKRIRPAILMAVGRTFGASDESLANSSAAVEMIHTYSLIHDDLPAMDDDELRRGRATCHIQFGEATAILAGDVLQTLAFKSMADDETLSAETRVRLVSLLAEASGTPAGMVAGQQLDLDAEGKELSIGEIETIHRQKTGALISAAAVAGAIIANATNNELSAIENYAVKLGLLFQITDDLLDVTQATETLGKTAGKDAAAEKATYPAHYGIERAMAMASAVRDEACESLTSIEKDITLLAELADFVLHRTR